MQSQNAHNAQKSTHNSHNTRKGTEPTSVSLSSETVTPGVNYYYVMIGS